MSIKAMKEAVHMLITLTSYLDRDAPPHVVDDSDEAIATLRQAIEQAEKQEPVGEIVKAFDDLIAVSIPVMPPVGTKLYTESPQREWVGLTDEEIVYEWELWRASIPRYVGFARGIEAKLREKNAYGWQSVKHPSEYLDELRGGADLCGND